MRNASPHYFTRHYFTRGCLLLLATLIGLADPARVMAGPEVSAQISAKNAPSQGPPIEIVTSPAGHTAWLVRDTSLPMVTLKVAWRGGSAIVFRTQSVMFCSRAVISIRSRSLRFN